MEVSLEVANKNLEDRVMISSAMELPVEVWLVVG